MRGRGFTLGALILGGTILVWFTILSIVAGIVIAVATLSQRSAEPSPVQTTKTQPKSNAPDCASDPYQYGCPR
jgi:hypothetical protein